MREKKHIKRRKLFWIALFEVNKFFKLKRLSSNLIKKAFDKTTPQLKVYPLQLNFISVSFSVQKCCFLLNPSEGTDARQGLKNTLGCYMSKNNSPRPLNGVKKTIRSVSKCFNVPSSAWNDYVSGHYSITNPHCLGRRLTISAQEFPDLV